MQTMQLLLRQPLHTGLGIVRPACQRSLVSSSSLPPKKLLLPVQSPASRNLSVCLRCQFRTQSKTFSSKRDNDSLPNPGSQFGNLPGTSKDFPLATTSEERDAQFLQQQTTEGLPKLEENTLPSESERRRSQLSKTFTELMDNIQGNVFIAGQKLNDLTGYSGIEKLKRDIEAQENQVIEARSLVRQAKEAYSAAINRRSASQREVNELLQRKHAWSAPDLERFTSLYRSDHANEVAEAEAQEALTKAEHDLEEANSTLNSSILSRYHEEQIWSDKIRRMSTWGTWGLMGVNVLLFLIFQILVEPWRRRRLVKGFEDKVKEAIETEAAVNRAIVANLTRAADAGISAGTVAGDEADPFTEPVSVPVPVPVPVSVAEAVVVVEDTTLEEISDTSSLPLPSPGDDAPPVETGLDNSLKGKKFTEQLSRLVSTEYWKHIIEDTFSDRHVVLTQRELSTIAIQSATVGAMIIGAMVAILRLR